jgi:glycosyltransferase involved in cell wall biosynthesis
MKSAQKYSISACFPAFNEEKNLPQLLQSADDLLQEIASDYEIIIVDDGSSDGTERQLHQLQTQYPCLKILKHSANQGYGTALLTAFRNASKTLVFFSDADLQFDLSELKKLLPLLNHADFATGYRGNRRDAVHRRFLAKVGNFLMRKCLGITVRDINCAFKIFRRSVLDQVDLDDFVSTGALINTEMYARLARKRITVAEIEVTHLPRKVGKQTGGNPVVLLTAYWQFAKLVIRLLGNRDD